VRTGLAGVRVGFAAEREGKDYAMDEANLGVEEVRKANKDLILEYDIAPIVVSPQACTVVVHILKLTETRFASDGEVLQLIGGINRELHLLQQEAKRDLGFDPAVVASGL
jgi:hypothetical protein